MRLSSSFASRANSVLLRGCLGRIYIAVVVLPLFWTSLALAAEQQQSTCRDRFEAGAALGWKRLEASMGEVTGVATCTRDFRSTNPKYAKDRWSKQVTHFWLTASAGKVITDSYDRSGKWTARNACCFNPDYAFAVKQPVQDGAYIITMHGRDPATIEQMKARVASYPHGMRASYDFDYAEIRTLAEIVKGEEFHLESCRDVERDGHRLVEAEFTFDLTGYFANGVRVRELGMKASKRWAKVVLDPSADWRILSSVVKYDQWTRPIEISYAPNSPAPAAMSKIVQASVASDGAKDTYVVDFSSVSFESTPLSEFYLGSFSLSEIPTGRQVRSWRLILTGLSLFAIGIVLYLLYRRSHSESSAT